MSFFESIVLFSCPSSPVNVVDLVRSAPAMEMPSCGEVSVQIRRLLHQGIGKVSQVIVRTRTYKWHDVPRDREVERPAAQIEALVVHHVRVELIQVLPFECCILLCACSKFDQALQQNDQTFDLSQYRCACAALPE